jgi:hypothetical protein
MFRNEFKSLNDLNFEGHKLLTKSFLVFGFFLVVLAKLIFISPAIIGIVFSVFIFLAGIFVLVARYYFGQTKGNQNYNLNSLDAEFNFIKTNYNRPRHYYFKKIRFIRC